MTQLRIETIDDGARVVVSLSTLRDVDDVETRLYKPVRPSLPPPVSTPPPWLARAPRR
jgi:hypothetical protein